MMSMGSRMTNSSRRMKMNSSSRMKNGDCRMQKNLNNNKMKKDNHISSRMKMTNT